MCGDYIMTRLDLKIPAVESRRVYGPNMTVDPDINPAGHCFGKHIDAARSLGLVYMKIGAVPGPDRAHTASAKCGAGRAPVERSRISCMTGQVELCPSRPAAASQRLSP